MHQRLSLTFQSIPKNIRFLTPSATVTESIGSGENRRKGEIRSAESFSKSVDVCLEIKYS